MTENGETSGGQLKQAQKLIYENNFGKALEVISDILSDEPESIDGLYMKAVCERYLERHAPALKTLENLKKFAPDFGRAWQEEGHVFRELNKVDMALHAYVQANRSNPALTASWQWQAKLFRQVGDAAQASQAEAQLRRLTSLPRELLAVTNFIHEGKLQKAEDLCRIFLQKHPRDTEAMRLLAEIGTRFGIYQDAEFLLESAVEFEPENVQLRLDYIQVLRKRQKFEAALEQAKYLHGREPDNPLFQSHLAIESMQIGDHETAFQYFDKVLKKVPNDAATLTSKGHALKTYGRNEEAVASYRAAYEAMPEHGDAFYSLANLKTYRFTDDEIGRMRKAVAGSHLTHMQRVHFNFALGKAYEDRADYEKSFEFYQHGNELKRLQSRYDADKMTAEINAQKEICTPDLFSKHVNKGCAAPDPIFIVGLPRAGSTLLEQILATHSQVDGTLELPNILSLAHRLRGRISSAEETRYPSILHDLTPEQLATYGEEYIANTRIHRQQAPFFTDKMPNNFRHIGLIHLILPNARIIDARREPMACCFSGFKQLFAEGQEFTYGLREVGQYYRDYVSLMQHWDSVLPGRILRVQYEDVVSDLRAQVMRILDFCGLPFEEACVDFYKTERSVRTASSEQVRQPIYQSGVAQWKHYEEFLSPLKTALGPALTEYQA
ncbi:tetratricopeptide repeat-containing sulfotransferase family protein [Parvularcula sp. IMCC14364]|uniref:tetratricopeptide repeat-containing sulfotransferase family protein n=1 Tax=Parvularcula sp. IMCC14364 TaxID=3067902 RepID=UPI002740CF51|nr:tetratricopeptide repeat-containing sulfotransferase family protein [Parvularcula sp. IMCC14364]